VCIYIDYNKQEALFKEKRQEKEELVDSSIQLPDMNYFISKAEHHGGDEKYSLIKQMMKALKYYEWTDTGLNTAGILVKDLCTGVPLHFSPSSASVVTHPDDDNLYNDFTFVNTRVHWQGAAAIKTRANRITEMFNCNEPVIGKYKGNDVRLHKIDNLPIDDIILSMKAHEDIMPFNNPQGINQKNRGIICKMVWAFWA